MIGKVESLDYDGDVVRRVRLTFPPVDRDGARDALTTMDIHMCECIGKGSFGTVYRAVSPAYPQLAVKISTGKTTRLKQELEVLRKVCTKGALQLPRFEFGALNQTSDLIVIGMELCMPCTLHDLLLSTRITNTRDMLFIAHQAVLAVGCVHDEGCIHRDVKLQNFVFDSQGNLKLIDFGLSCNTLKPPAGDIVAGTVSFMSPEMAFNVLHDKEQRVSVGASADVWSLGIVLFSIFTQRNPYPGTAASSSSDASKGEPGPGSASATGGDKATSHANGSDGATVLSRKRINEGLFRRVSRGEWQWPAGCTVSAELKQLVDAVLVIDPAQRPTVAQILSMKVWNNRARAPPSAVTAFLGVQDDFFFSNNEETLLRAVEQRSEGVKASQGQSRPNSRAGSQARRAPRNVEADEEVDGDEARLQPADDQKRDSLKFVATEAASAGDVPSVQVYDVRASTKKHSKPIREISQVIAEETAKSTAKTGTEGTRRARSARSKRSEAPTAATAPASRMPSRPASAPASRAGSQQARADPSKSTGEAELTDAATPKHTSAANAYEVKSSPSTVGNSSGEVSAANDGIRGGGGGVERHAAPGLAEEPVRVCTRLEDQFNRDEAEGPPRPGRLSRSEPALPTGGSLHLTTAEAMDEEHNRHDSDEDADADAEDEEAEATSRRRKASATTAPPRTRSRDTSLRERSSSILNGVSRPGSRETSLAVPRGVSQLSSRQGSRRPLPPPAPAAAPVAVVAVDPFLPVAPTAADKSAKRRRAAKKRARSIPRDAASTEDAVKPLTPSKRLVLELNMDVLVQQERDCRAVLFRHFVLEHEWLVTVSRIVAEEDQERAHIVWNGTEQLANLEHPHKFKELVEIPNKTYLNGFTCDACLYDFFPRGRLKRDLHFFHCTCGQDLCADCYRDYALRCTCACCGVVHPNLKALRDHTRSGVAGCRPRAAAGIVSGPSLASSFVPDAPSAVAARAAPPSLGSTSRLAASRGQVAAPAAGARAISPARHLRRSAKPAKSVPAAAAARMGVAQGAMQQRVYAASEAASYDDQPHPRAENEEDEYLEDDALDDDEDDEDDAVPSRRAPRRGAQRAKSAPRRRPPVPRHFEREIDELPKGPWRPFEKLRRDRNEDDPSRKPTPQERNAILNGEWLRYFYFYPGVETNETFAFVYHAQPGRTGAVFVNHEFHLHSAVFSMLEHQFFAVDSIRVECPTEEDTTFAMPLAMARSNTRVKDAYHAVESIVAHDTNMAKQQRAPGTMSVYFPPTNMYSSKGSPILYVRWFRCSEDHAITAILLSNNAMQVFVNNEFELRWFDAERKFLVGKNGTCEVIDDSTFELAPLINHVLYGAYDV